MAGHGIGIGIIGNGMASRVFHVPYILATPALELRGVVSRRADQPPPAPNVPLLCDTAGLLTDPAIKIVVIATPSATHADLARQAITAGKHVVVEKPFALDLAQAREIVDLAADHGVMLTAFHNRRWDSDFLAVRAALATGIIGQPVHYEAHYDRFRPAVRQRWREDGGAGSGVWFDLGPHLIDQAITLFGMPDAVSAEIAALRPGSRADDWAHVILHYPGMRAVLHAGMCVAGGVPRCAVHGLAGSLVKQQADPQEAQSLAGLRPAHADWGMDHDPLRYWPGDGTVREYPAPRGCHPQFYALLAEACAVGGPAPIPAADILAVQQVLDASFAAAREGRRMVLTPHGS